MEKCIPGYICPLPDQRLKGRLSKHFLGPQNGLQLSTNNTDNRKETTLLTSTVFVSPMKEMNVFPAYVVCAQYGSSND